VVVTCTVTFHFFYCDRQFKACFEDAFENPPESTEERITFIKSLRETRDKGKVEEAIRHLREKAQMGEKENLMPPIMEALTADATIGEILGTIRETWELSYDPLGVLQSPFKG